MFEIYTDGSCYPNPGPGGRCYIIIECGKVINIGKGGSEKTTNNRMETLAFLHAMHYVSESYGHGQQLKLYSDSNYVLQGINKLKSGTTHKTNSDLRAKGFKLIEKQQLQTIWVRGHDGNKYNEICDVEAGEQRKIIIDKSINKAA